MSEAPDSRLAAAVESLLFASPEPLSVTRITEVLEVSAEDVTMALGYLTNGAYRDRGVQVVAVAGGYQMATNPDFAHYVGRLLAPPPPRLSRAAMETLAIIAYRQPCTLPEIEAIRGVDASGVVRTLQERGMVQDVGHKETVGRPTLYATTSAFLIHFGLNGIEDLPPLPESEDGETEVGSDGQLLLVEPYAAPPESRVDEVEGVDGPDEMPAVPDANTGAEGEAPAA